MTKLYLFDLDQTLVDTSHCMKYLANGSQDIDAFRLRDTSLDTLIEGTALEAFKAVPKEQRGILTSRVLCSAEKRALHRLGLGQSQFNSRAILARPENSPLPCPVLKSANVARILRKPHLWSGIVFFEDAIHNLKAVAETCKVFGIDFTGYHVQGEKVTHYVAH